MLLEAAAPFVSRLHELWAYTTLGATSIVTEELAPIVGGVAAAQGHLGLKRAMLAVALGSWTATALLYVLGWWRGEWVRRRWADPQSYMQRALRAVSSRPWRSALIVRFAFGARILLPIACGAAHVPPPTYLIGTAVSSVVWSALFIGIGWAFGETAVGVLGRVRRYDDYIVLAVIALVALAFGVFRWRASRRKAARAAVGSVTPLAADPVDH